MTFDGESEPGFSHVSGVAAQPSAQAVGRWHPGVAHARHHTGERLLVGGGADQAMDLELGLAQELDEQLAAQEAGGARQQDAPAVGQGPIAAVSAATGRMSGGSSASASISSASSRAPPASSAPGRCCFDSAANSAVAVGCWKKIAASIRGRRPARSARALRWPAGSYRRRRRSRRRLPASGVRASGEGPPARAAQTLARTRPRCGAPLGPAHGARPPLALRRRAASREFAARSEVAARCS